LGIIVGLVVWSNVNTPTKNKNNKALITEGMRESTNVVIDDSMKNRRTENNGTNNPTIPTLPTGKVGCIKEAACDYDDTARVQGPSCTFAWYVFKDGNKFMPERDEDIRNDNIRVPELKPNTVCNVEGKCTDALYVRSETDYYDGRRPSYVQSTTFYTHVKEGGGAWYAGTHACTAAKKLAEVNKTKK
jgi:hypothetical protein